MFPRLIREMRISGSLTQVITTQVSNFYKLSRTTSKVFPGDQDNPPVFNGQIELYTHADTLVVWRNFTSVH